MAAAEEIFDRSRYKAEGPDVKTRKKHRLNRRLKGVYDAKEETQPSEE